MKTYALIIEKHYQLILWMLPKMAAFPKDQRFLLADRIEKVLLNILEMLIACMFSADRKELLREINLQLDFLRLLMRLSKDMHYVSLKGYDFFCQQVLEIGRMAGGWGKMDSR